MKPEWKHLRDELPTFNKVVLIKLLSGKIYFAKLMDAYQENGKYKPEWRIVANGGTDTARYVSSYSIDEPVWCELVLPE